MKISKEKIIARFNELYKELERVPNRDELGYRQPINRIYGGYNNFLRELGHLPNFARTENDYIDYVRKLYKELNKVPSLNDLEDKGVYRASIYMMFGSYNNLLRKAGLDTTEIVYTDKTKKELLDDYIEVSNNLGKWATVRELESINIYENRFGSIVKVRKLVVNDEKLKIGDKTIEERFQKYSDEDIEEYVEKAIQKHGKGITKIEMVKFLENIKGPSINTITKRRKATSFRDMIEEHINNRPGGSGNE